MHAGYDLLCSEVFLPISVVQDDVSISSIISIFILDTGKINFLLKSDVRRTQICLNNIQTYNLDVTLCLKH